MLREISNYESLNNRVTKDVNDNEKQKLLNTVKRMNIELEDNLKKFEFHIATIKANPFHHKKVSQLWEKVFFLVKVNYCCIFGNFFNKFFK